MTALTPRQSLLSLTVCTVIGLTSISDAFMPSTSTIIVPSLSTRDCTIPASCSTALFASVSSKASIKKSKSKMKKKLGPTLPQSTRIPGPGRSLSQDELSDHVNKRYSGMISMEDKDGREMTSSEVDMEEQEAFLRELSARPALVLNADFQPLSYLPLSLWSWQDAVKAIFGGKVQVVDVYPDICVRAANLEVPLPSVIALSEYVPHKNQRPAFTRRNVFLRDEYKCQYCNDRFHTADLSLDHVHPRCMGGQLTWENAVTSCLKCNGKKGSKPVTELRSIGMRLIREPRCPTQMELAAKAARMVPRRVHNTWKPFLGIAETPKKNSGKAVSSSQRGGDEESIDDRYFEGEELYFEGVY